MPLDAARRQRTTLGMPADARTYLADLCSQLRTMWPNNRTLRIVAHGHSIPAGYFCTPEVRTFDSYPHLLHRALTEKFPWAVLNVIVTAIGGESSSAGARRFDADVLSLRPDLVTIDYAFNDIDGGLDPARAAWTAMIHGCQARGVPVLLVTPAHFAHDGSDAGRRKEAGRQAHAQQVRELAGIHGVGLADADRAWDRHLGQRGDLAELLSQANHPNRRGHELIARELERYFPMA